MIAITNDGKWYSGGSPEAVVTRMREDGLFTISKTDQEYMRFVSLKTLQFEGAVIRFTDATTFLNDLAINDILTIGDL